MRPTEYTYEMAGDIAYTFAISGMKLAELCEQHNDWPAKGTVVKWLYENKEFSDLMLDAVKIRDGDDAFNDEPSNV